MCFALFSEEVATICLYRIIIWLVFIKEAGCVYCAVRTEFLNVLQLNFNLIVKDLSTNWVSNIATNLKMINPLALEMDI